MVNLLTVNPILCKVIFVLYSKISNIPPTPFPPILGTIVVAVDANEKYQTVYLYRSEVSCSHNSKLKQITFLLFLFLGPLCRWLVTQTGTWAYASHINYIL